MGEVPPDLEQPPRRVFPSWVGLANLVVSVARLLIELTGKHL